MLNTFKGIASFFTIFSLILLGSCEKAETQNAQQTGNAKNLLLGIESKRDDGFSGSPLVDNGDGSWSANLYGSAVRFSNFIYEIPIDVNTGQQILPPTGHPAWPASIGPDPDVVSGYPFYCLEITSIPNDIDYTLVVIPRCKYQGVIYVRGAGTREYQNKVAEAESFYDLQMQAYFLEYQVAAAQAFTYSVSTGTPYAPPVLPQPRYNPYPLVDGWSLIKKDFVSSPTSNPFALVKFTVVNTNGTISYKMDVKG